MQCADLERYLEAYLDGRLGRSRGLLLRRHLGVCPGCAARVERLRQFERDINRRLRIMERAQSVWGELEPEPGRRSLSAIPTASAGLRLLPAPTKTVLPRAGGPAASVRKVRPPRRRSNRGRRILTRLLGALMIAGAAGAVVQIVRPYLSSNAASDPAVLGYLDFVRGDNVLAMQTTKPESLRDWFTARLGRDFPPLPEPDGFVMTGGRLDYLAGEPSALIAYQRDATPALLYVQPSDDGAVSPEGRAGYAEEDGVTRLSWQSQAYSFAIVSSLPAAALSSFADAKAPLP